MEDKKLNPFYSIQLFGLKNYFDDFVQLFEKNKFPRVLMLSGNKGIGKFTLIFHLINYILSKNTTDTYKDRLNVINKNNYFYKEILSNICQNFVYISNDNEKKISVDNIRDFKKNFNNTILNKLPRFVVFDDVELLNVYASNSILKLIEEPSSSNYFILINNQKSNIIETIKSRALETKIFLSKDERSKILDQLIKSKGINDHFIHKYNYYSTPGMVIRYSEIITNLNIDINMSFYEIAFLLLDKYKKNKSPIYLDTLIFFLEIKFQLKNKNSIELIKLINQKNRLMKLLYDYKKFNLTNNSVLEYIKISEKSYA